MVYRARYEQTRQAMQDSTEELEQLRIDDSGERKFLEINELVGRVQRHAQATRDSLLQMDAAVSVLRERVKWIWWVVVGMLGALAWMSRAIIEWQLGKH